MRVFGTIRIDFSRFCHTTFQTVWVRDASAASTCPHQGPPLWTVHLGWDQQPAVLDLRVSPYPNLSLRNILNRQ